MSSAVEKAPDVLFPHVTLEAPKFQVSAFGLAHRAIVAMRNAGISDKDIEEYKDNVKGLNLDDTMVITMCTIRVVG